MIRILIWCLNLGRQLTGLQANCRKVTNCQYFVFLKIKFLLKIRQVRKRGFGIDLGLLLPLQRLWKKQPRKDGEFWIMEELKIKKNKKLTRSKNPPLKGQERRIC